MASLIITILSIAIVAIVSIMGVFYGGTVFQNEAPQVWANAAIAQDQQLFAAFNVYSANNGGANFTTVGFSDLINDGYLSTWPDVIMAGPSPNTGNVKTGVYDGTNCAPVNGYQGQISRDGAVILNTNVVYLNMVLNDPYTGTCNSGGPVSNAGHGYGFEDARYSNHPYVQLALAINKITGAVPSTNTIAGSGLPYGPAGITFVTTTVKGSSWSTRSQDGSGNLIKNYCYLSSSVGGTSVTAIQCNFTQ